MRIRIKIWSVCRRVFIMGKMARAWKASLKMLVKMWPKENGPGLWRLNYGTPEYFTRCYWQKKEKVLPLWLAYRLVLFLYFLATTLFTILDPNIPSKDKPKYLIFLTNWCYVLQFIQFGVAFYVTASRYSMEKKNPTMLPMDKTPLSYKIYWVMYTIVLPVSATISILFWCLVYEPLLFPVNAHNLIVHCFNSIIMFLDFILVAFPIRLSYVIFPNIFTFIYIVFTIIYQFSGGTGTKGMKNIYKILDWESPFTTIGYCGMGVFAVVFFYTLFWIFSLVKENLRSEAE